MDYSQVITDLAIVLIMLGGGIVIFLAVYGWLREGNK